MRMMRRRLLKGANSSSPGPRPLPAGAAIPNPDADLNELRSKIAESIATARFDFAGRAEAAVPE